MKRKRQSLDSLIQSAVTEVGKRRALAAIESLIDDSRGDVLTVVANQGTHKIPDRYLRGEIFVASQGNLDFSSAREIKRQFQDILGALRDKLKERAWRKVYLIPTGHPALSIQIKLGIYRISRITTSDVFYYNGQYFDIDIDIRHLD